jgi:acetyl-CoA synthetase
LLSWYKAWDTVGTGDYASAPIRCFEGAKLNVCYNCIDRHLPQLKDKTAFFWEGDDPQSACTLTYQQLYETVCQTANALKAMGVRKGDRVCLYLPMIPEAVISMLACARIGAIHSVIFGGFSAEALYERIQDTGAHIVITADEARRGGKIIPLKQIVDLALELPNQVMQVLVLGTPHTQVSRNLLRDVDFYSLVNRQAKQCSIEWMDAEDPLFILYTSGSTGQPKGVCHTTAGYLLYVTMTFRYAFDYKQDDIYWCTADIGWITGHSYLVYGPLANGATSVLFEGTPQYPTPARYWQVIEKYQVTIFYTAPTAIRTLKAEGDSYPNAINLNSLRILGTVGEPINSEAWNWYYSVIGKKRCLVVDTWWQTETGGIMIAPWPHVVTAQPGAAGLPFFGIIPAVLDDHGTLMTDEEEGLLIIQRSWPGQMRTLYGDPVRFQETYFEKYPGVYCTGDGARKDKKGHYWIAGRIDDMINMSGHRIGTAEIESALLLHQNIAVHNYLNSWKRQKNLIVW